MEETLQSFTLTTVKFHRKISQKDIRKITEKISDEWWVVEVELILNALETFVQLMYLNNRNRWHNNRILSHVLSTASSA